MQGITRHSCQEEVTEMEDKLINRTLVCEEFPIHNYWIFFASISISNKEVVPAAQIWNFFRITKIHDLLSC